MQNAHKSSLLTVLFLASIAAAMPLSAAPLAEVSYGPSAIEWDPRAGLVRLTLVVTGPEGFIYRSEFGGHEQPVFAFVGEDGRNLPDGGYNWELRGRPAADEGDSSGSGEAPPLSGLTLAGFFRLDDGQLIAPGPDDEVEFSMKVFFDEDAWVRGGFCVGQDCEDGGLLPTPFLLKDKAPRVRFEDSSTAAGEPSNDWQITVNDEAVGGSDKFSIEDIDGGATPFTIEAGTPGNALFLDDSGRVGIGTSTPTVDLHVVNDDTAPEARATVAVEGNGPTFRMVNTGAYGGYFDLMINPLNGRFLVQNPDGYYPLKVHPHAAENLLRLGLVEDDMVEVFGDLKVAGLQSIEAEGPALRLINLGVAGNTFDLMVNGGNGRFFVESAPAVHPFKIAPTAAHNLLRLGIDASGQDSTRQITIDGDLEVLGHTTSQGFEIEDADPTLVFTESTQSWNVVGNATSLSIRDATNGAAEPFRIEASAPSDALFIGADGKVGLGTSNPASSLTVEDSQPELRLANLGPAGGGWIVFANANTGRFVLKDLATDQDPLKIEPGSDTNLVRLGLETDGTVASDTVSIGSTNVGAAVLQVFGSIEVDGTVVHADYVFEPGYELDSIEEQADFMWRNKHLPALPKAPEGRRGPVDLVSHQMGMLEELEKAHIYIDQLHGAIEEMRVRLETVEQCLAE